MILPPLPDRFEPARDALHAYARVVGSITRAHAPVRPHWWHLGLEVRPDGLSTVPVPLPGGGAAAFRLDPAAAAIEATSSRGDRLAVDLRSAGPRRALEDLNAFAGSLGLGAGIDAGPVPAGEVDVDWDVAAAYHRVLVDVAVVLERRRAELDGAGPLLVWPHGFDLAFEWFGSRRVEAGDGTLAPAQLNLGFSPDDGGYLYSNPWPFDPSLTSEPLPAGASWHLDGWQGTILPYAEVSAGGDGAERVLAYAHAVFAAARPTLDV